ncbi:SRPBCC family protein [Nitriliruptor alkaliphilus]|uniref:SRPBCC family protein n=1 Tax=Nitriliruptor alkaliphilus TaxID=427918 RepID=UPI0009F9DFFF|nr:SRPBCC family protein [Nitriliruptor alkaliphilus]
MQLRNTFSVPAPPDAAFAALLDLERIAPCMPGAELTGRDGEAFQGRLKLRVGPITAAYQGAVTVGDADAVARRARLTASGTEIGGQGAASATVVATVSANGVDGSQVEVVTDLDIRGKAAQFGRGALGEVTQRVLDQFARNLEATFTAPAITDGHAGGLGPAPAAAGEPPSPTTAGPAGDDLDVLRVIVGPLVARAAPVLAALAIGVLLGRATRRRSPRAPSSAPWPPPPWWAPPG